MFGHSLGHGFDRVAASVHDVEIHCVLSGFVNHLGWYVTDLGFQHGLSEGSGVNRRTCAFASWNIPASAVNNAKELIRMFETLQGSRLADIDQLSADAVSVVDSR